MVLVLVRWLVALWKPEWILWKPAKMSSMEHRAGWYALGVGAAISGMLVFWRCKAKSAPKFVQPSTGAVAGKVTDCECARNSTGWAM